MLGLYSAYTSFRSAMELDPKLLPRLLDGSPAAWSQFVQASAPVVWGQVRRCFARYGAQLNEGDMEDVSQNVFMRLARGDYGLLRKFDPARAKLSTYLGVIAHSCSVDFLRKRRAAAEDIADHEYHLAAPAPTDHDGGSTAGVLRLIPGDLLSQRQEAILRKLFDEDQDVDEVAEALGVEAQTIRSAKHKALAKIRVYFDQNPQLKEAA